MRLLLLLLTVLALAGCGDQGPADDGRVDTRAPVVVATTTHGAALADRVMCDPNSSPCVAKARTILPAGADPHDYELRPDDVAALADADLIIRSGGEIDEWLGEAIAGTGTKAPVVDLLQAAGGDDPHWWVDPQAARRAVGAIQSALVKISPAYLPAWNSYGPSARQALQTLDVAIKACVDQIPRRQRKVVTSHDALGRFASRYGIEVVGTVIPSRSTQAQSSSADVARLVRAIKESGATAVFSEANVSRDVERAIAEQAGARLGPPLQLDAIAPGDDYFSSMEKNAAALVDGMSGGKVKCWQQS